MDQATSERMLSLLEQLCSDIASMRQSLETVAETLDSFTEEGFPLRSSMPTPEMISAVATSCALLLRETPLSPQDVTQRVQAAQSLAKYILEAFDHHQSATRNTQLEGLLQR